MDRVSSRDKLHRSARATVYVLFVAVFYLAANIFVTSLSIFQATPVLGLLLLPVPVIAGIAGAQNQKVGMGCFMAVAFLLAMCLVIDPDSRSALGVQAIFVVLYMLVPVALPQVGMWVVRFVRTRRRL